LKMERSCVERRCLSSMFQKGREGEIHCRIESYCQKLLSGKNVELEKTTRMILNRVFAMIEEKKEGTCDHNLPRALARGGVIDLMEALNESMRTVQRKDPTERTKRKKARAN
jgi:non-homologous end joining protein Ku